MKFSIGKFDAASGSVPVTFKHGSRTHKRMVNAALDANGGYDARATRERVSDVAEGVKVKMDLGLLRDG